MKKAKDEQRTSYKSDRSKEKSKQSSRSSSSRSSRKRSSSSRRSKSSNSEEETSKPTPQLKGKEEEKEETNKSSRSKKSSKSQTSSSNTVNASWPDSDYYKAWSVKQCKQRLKKNDQDVYALFRISEIYIEFRRESRGLDYLNALQAIDPEFRKIDQFKLRILAHDYMDNLEDCMK